MTGSTAKSNDSQATPVKSDIETKAKSVWKEITICVVTLVGTATFFQGIVLPNYVQVKENKISKLENEIIALKNSQKRDAIVTQLVGDMEVKNKRLKEDNKRLEQRIALLEREMIFKSGSVYLTGYADFVIGDQVEKVIHEYGEKRARQNDVLVEVSHDDGFIEYVTYPYIYNNSEVIGGVVYTPVNSTVMKYIIERFKEANPGVLKEYKDGHDGGVSYRGRKGEFCISMNLSYYKIDGFKINGECL